MHPYNIYTKVCTCWDISAIQLTGLCRDAWLLPASGLQRCRKRGGEKVVFLLHDGLCLKPERWCCIHNSESNSITVSDIRVNTNYTFMVRAVNCGGIGNYSKEKHHMIVVVGKQLIIRLSSRGLEIHYYYTINFWVVSTPDPPTGLSVCHLKEVLPPGQAHSHRQIRLKYDVSCDSNY